VAHGLTLNERDVHEKDLDRTTECFVTSATREIMPVVSLRMNDGRMIEFPAGGGEITRKVAGYYKKYIHEHIKKNASLSLW
jgi:branched-subunit amino acid aminotransferase/4-amino-4-deoxychorismate lyase